MKEWVSLIGARIGNWNDIAHRADSRKDRTAAWHRWDRLARWLYTLPERRQ